MNDQTEVNDESRAEGQSRLNVGLGWQNPEYEMINSLFHSLWTKAGTTDYNKSEWKAMAKELTRLGIPV